MNHETGKILLVLGGCLAGVGLLLISGHSLSWIGKLPGDLSIRRENFSFYFPITTCLVVSVVVTAILFIIRK